MATFSGDVLYIPKMGQLPTPVIHQPEIQQFRDSCPNPTPIIPVMSQVAVRSLIHQTSSIVPPKMEKYGKVIYNVRPPGYKLVYKPQ